ncbi:MAG TPA: GntR family transcriptional regulator [Phycisphaerae bacterium]|nr:GntR family transcriptional regulator [Phycisphaerae bacterium]HOI55061.1 GntR family transcriptional regulator [Phycisphaerae bacterium]
MARPVVPERVYRYLLEKLAAGQWQPGDAVPPLRAMAHELNISHWPVYKMMRHAVGEGLLEHRPRRRARVAPEAPERARLLLASMESTAGGTRLAILVPQEPAGLTFPVGNPVHANLVQAVGAASVSCGSTSHVVCLDDLDPMRQAGEIVRRYDAAFAVGLGPRNLVLMTHLAQSRLPLLTYQTRIPGLEIPTLYTDSYSAGRRLAELLVQHDHTNVCMIASIRCESIMDERYLGSKGWLDGLREFGICDQCVMPIALDRGANHDLLIQKILRLSPRPTALVFEEPHILARLLRAPWFRSMRDLALATLGAMDRTLETDGVPPITSFDVDWTRAGQCAVEVLCRMTSGTMHQKCIRISMRLNLTDSLGCCSVSTSA